MSRTYADYTHPWWRRLVVSREAVMLALLVGLVDTFGKVLIPQTAGILVYVLMAAILLWRPEGLFRAG